MKYILSILLLSSTVYATSYETDAKPIFKNRCIICHTAQMTPDKDWMNYDIAFAKKDLIKKRVWILKDMPQGNATGMTDSEREVIKNWVDEGGQK